MIKMIFLDFGGVLWEAQSSEFYPVLCNRLNISEERFRSVRMEHDRDLATGKMTFEQFASLLEKVCGLHGVAAIWEGLFRERLHVRKGFPELIAQLRPHHRIGILSNQYSLHARVNGEVGILREYDPVIMSCEVGFCKPQPEIYHIAEKRANVTAKECILVDDRERNIEAATARGWDGILFQNVEQLKEELNKRRLLGPEGK